MGRSRPGLLALAAGALLAATACAVGATPSRSLAADQTLRFPIPDDFGTLDPGLSSAASDQDITQNLYDGVVRLDQNLKLAPDIAAALPTVSADGLTYTFHLRHAVRFSNGDPVTAKDVLYSWNRGAALQGPHAGNFAAVAGFDNLSKSPPAEDVLEPLLAADDPSVTMPGLTAPDGPDGYTVRVRLTRPAGWFLSAVAVAGSPGEIVDSRVVQSDPLGWWTKPATLVGTGPYRMSARVPGRSADFEAVPGWWGSPRPTVKHVHLDIVKEPPSAITAYERGKYDVYGYGGYSTAPVDQLLRVTASPVASSQLLLHPGSRSYWVTFNMSADVNRPAKGPFATDQPGSKDLRMAFALAVDRQELASAVCHDLVCAPMTGGVVAKGLAGYLGDNQDPLARFDPTAAQQLLQKADPDRSRTRGLSYVYDPEKPLNGAAARFLQDQWQTNLGVHVDLRPESHSQFIKDRLAGDFVLSRDGWEADYNHPQDWFDNNWTDVAGCPDSPPCGSGYDNPQLNALAARADALPLRTALPIYEQMSRTLSGDAVYVPLFYTVGAYLIKPYVQGAGANSQFDYLWSGVKILKH